MSEMKSLLMVARLLDKSVWRREGLSDLQAYIKLWNAISISVAILIGFAAHWIYPAPLVSVVVSLCLGPVLIDAAHLVSSRLWVRRERTLAQSDDLFNYKRYLEDQLEAELMRIARLQIDVGKKEVLIVQTYEKNSVKMQAVDEQIARSRSTRGKKIVLQERVLPKESSPVQTNPYRRVLGR